MKISAVLLLPILFLASCEDNSFERKGNPVNLIEEESPSLFAKTVILFNDENYQVKTPLSSFTAGHPFNSHDGYYNSYRDKAIEDSKTYDVLESSDYMPYKQDTIYTLAYHLENGSCLLWDKKAQKSIKTIYIDEYYEGQPMAGHGGRKFYIRDKLFLTTIDWISK